MAEDDKIGVGFITYSGITAKYLPYFLPSLFAQTEKNFFVLAFDNTEEKNNPNIKYINSHYPQVEILSVSRNIGFARAYNKLIKEAIKRGAEYFLAINPDIILEPKALKEMVKALAVEGNLAAVSPKILYWDFANKKKTNIIDSCGIVLERGLRFRDAGQGEIDQGQYDKAPIIGPSGAAGMYRISVLEKIKKNGQYFDERFFMYKEDCDLAYRLYLAGFKTKPVSNAIVYHHRTVSSRGKKIWQIIWGRRQKSKQAKKWSFFGQQIIFFKYWHRQNWRNKLAVLYQELKMIVFVLLFEPYLLKELYRAWRLGCSGR
jgi:GT2 family glycosyltransferase